MKNKSKIIKIIILSSLVVLCLVLTVFVLIPFIKHLMTDAGRIAIQEKVDSLGIFAPLAYILMETTHIVLAFIPGGPVEIIGGVLFGAFWGVILCEAGILIATTIIYYLVRKFGKPLVNTFVSEEKFKKFRFLQDEKKLELITFVLCLIPGTPKDVITYVVSLTKIKPSRMIPLVTIARVPSLVSSAMMGATLSQGKLLITGIIFIITVAIGVAGIFINNKVTSAKNSTKKE